MAIGTHKQRARGKKWAASEFLLGYFFFMQTGPTYDEYSIGEKGDGHRQRGSF